MKKSFLITILFTLIGLILIVLYIKGEGRKYLSTNFEFMKSPSTHEALFIKTYPVAVLEQLWVAYKDKIQKDGRTIDRSLNYLTTSEGQSYSLLRAVWIDDKEVFDRVLNWTNNNLQKRPDDELFAWKWGQNPSGKWDVLVDEGGMNTASDADQDIALALIFASQRWNDKYYLDQALIILNDIWQKEVYELNGNYYLVAGNWAKEEPQPTINPSYFSFAAYPIFAKVDPSHPWDKLKDTSYSVLFEATEGNLGFEKSVNLPPDWVNLDPTTGRVIEVIHDDKATHFSDDAIRVPYRVALDWQWHKDPRAKEYLEKLKFLDNEWQNRKKISKEYNHDGSISNDSECNSLYGMLLPAFAITAPKTADEIYVSKIAPLYNPDTEDFKEDIGYYAQNLVWFGMAAYSNRLINLYVIE